MNAYRIYYIDDNDNKRWKKIKALDYDDACAKALVYVRDCFGDLVDVIQIKG